MRTQAAVLRGSNQPFVIEEIELEAPGPGEALVRVRGTGMCHTDLVARHAVPISLPTVFGHEGSGVIEALGSGVTRVAVGDHVVMSYDSCGWCAQCLGGEPSYCDQFMQRNFLGRRANNSGGAADQSGAPVGTRWFGQSSFATHAIATERNLVKVDPSLPLELLGPLGCGFQTGAGSVFNALKVRPGSIMAVYGAGAVGLAAVMAAKVAGASKIIAVDLHAKRRALAIELGATRVFDGADPDVAAQISSACKKTGGANYALDTTGVPSVIRLALSTLRIRGTCGLVAGARELALDITTLVGRSVTLILEGDAVPQLFIPALIRLWQAGRFPFDRLIRTYPLNAINDAERDSASGETIKPVLLPST
jgi:aryl-alcohol dehydrogenase